MLSENERDVAMKTKIHVNQHNIRANDTLREQVMYNRLLREAHRNANIALFRVTVRDSVRRLREFLRQVKRWLERDDKRTKQLGKSR